MTHRTTHIHSQDEPVGWIFSLFVEKWHKFARYMHMARLGIDSVVVFFLLLLTFWLKQSPGSCPRLGLSWVVISLSALACAEEVRLCAVSPTAIPTFCDCTLDNTHKSILSPVPSPSTALLLRGAWPPRSAAQNQPSLRKDRQMDAVAFDPEPHLRSRTGTSRCMHSRRALWRRLVAEASHLGAPSVRRPLECQLHAQQ
eukprot:4111072-Prymnesium_polylepis.1